MTGVISAVDLRRSYRSSEALAGVTFTAPEGSVTGLLGRNGAGKSTLMRIAAGQEFASSGTVEVFGESPVENERVLRRMALVREDQMYPDIRVRHAIAAASWFHPNWNAELARRLLREFDLPPNRRIKKLSRGMRSAVGIVIGLASRAELTLLDEPYAGLDPVARRMFYDHLLADLAEHPRTVVLSTHLVDEVSGLLDHIVILDRGRIVIDAPVDELQGRAVTLVGPTPAVDELVAGQTIWDRRSIGHRSSVTVAGPVSDRDRSRARPLGVDLEPVSLQDLVVHIVEAGGSRAARTDGDPDTATSWERASA